MVAGSDGYIPDRGHLVWVLLDPTRGREQSGRRPVVILSPRSYNGRVGLAVGCPVTRSVKGYPFEVALPVDCVAQGVVLADQVKSFDWRVRDVEFAALFDDGTLRAVSRRAATLIG